MRLSNRMIAHDEDVLNLKKARGQETQVLEKLVRAKSPLPISYDVDCTQGLNFHELTYTEFLGGLLISTQNIEINTKLRKMAADDMQCDLDYASHLSAIHKDKYQLSPCQDKYKHVAFMVGHNMFDLVSPEIVARLAHENKQFMVKLHPLTNHEYASKVARAVGWDRIIPANVSGVELIDNCDVAYVTTATELCALAVAKRKKIANISSFFHESGGAYYSINTFLFKSTDPYQTLNNIVGSKFSGLVFPWMDDVEERIECFFKMALKLREMHAPLASANMLKKAPA